MPGVGRASVRPSVLQRYKGGLKPALLFWAGVMVAHAEPVITWRMETGRQIVEVAESQVGSTMLPPSSTLTVFVEQGGSAAVPAMAGTLRRVDGRLQFEPRFPLARGVRYRAEFRASPEAVPVVSYFSLPAENAAPATVVQQVYPSAAVLPENLLKFYVHFSAPMTRGAAYQNIHLRDASGAVIDLPFLELPEELWDASMTRLTLLIDPGRIKRGVKPLEDIGPVFETGRRYSLTVDTAWRDAAGQPLRERFEKKFQAGPADRTPPETTRWKLHAPAAGGRGALVVDFDEPMDHALTLRLLAVVKTGGDGRAVRGDETLGREERQWTFVPDDPWSPGAYELKIATTIEDLAGNNVGKAFDVDVFESVERKIKTPVVSVAFSVR